MYSHSFKTHKKYEYGYTSGFVNACIPNYCRIKIKIKTRVKTSQIYSDLQTCTERYLNKNMFKNNPYVHELVIRQSNL